jgi:hemerythrin
MAVLLEGHMPNNEVFFKWSQEYSVNIKAIDDQHKELVAILNRLFLAVSRQEGDKVIAGILDALTDYTRTHFALEERLMREAKYAELDAHMEEHHRLIEKLDRLCKVHLLEEKPIYFEMLSFLKSWLKEHIQGEDTKYSAALQKAGFSFVSWEQEANQAFARMSANEKNQWWKIWKAA